MHLSFLPTLLLSVASAQRCPAPHPDPSVINVHLAPHTHDDLGWLKTVEEYYYGNDPKHIVNAGVQYILDSVVGQLMLNKNRRFSYAETGFFWRWWNEQDVFVQDIVKQMVNEGRLQFIGGGWVQNDEACTHYQAIIDQMSYGLRKLNETFGEASLPITAWQIDPFGHSRGYADLVREMGFTSLHFARLHWLDHRHRLGNKEMCMDWVTNENKDTLPTCVFYQMDYNAPPTFCFDEYCSNGDNPPIMDDKTLEDYNVKERIGQLVKQAKAQAKVSATNHVQFLMGQDFTYMNGGKWFANMDRLIKHTNATETGVNVLYSSPECFYAAVNGSRTSANLPGWKSRKTDDFFTYANKQHSYWSGYFTSRPTFKRYIRKCSALLQTCNAAVATNSGELSEAEHNEAVGQVDILRRAVALCQHHDAVTGTAKQSVTDDYARQLARGVAACEGVLAKMQAARFAKSNKRLGPAVFCTYSNISVCDVSQSETPYTITLYNRLAHEINHTLTIPTANTDAWVLDESYAKMPFFSSATFPSNDQFAYAPTRATHQLSIPVTFGGLSQRVIMIAPKTPRFTRIGEKKILKRISGTKSGNAILDTWHTNITSSIPSCGNLTVCNKIDNVCLPINHYFAYYTSATKADGQPSGAYIFRPTSSNVTRIHGNLISCSVVNSSPIIQELRVVTSSWVTHSIRIYANRPGVIEVEWTVGPIPAEDMIGREVIVRFHTPINSGKTFYTDANGREMLERQLNHEDTYTFDDGEPVAANYYPVNTRIAIKDGSTQLTLLTDRSCGGSSLKTGQMELMLHRRIHHDDYYGVDEPLNEPGVDGRGLVARGVITMILSRPETAASYHRPIALEVFIEPVVMFAPVMNTTTEELINRLNHDGEDQLMKMQSGINLPHGVHLLSLEHTGPNSVMIRLEHIYPASENGHEVDVDLTPIVPAAAIAKEVLLAGVRNVEGSVDVTQIKLMPMQIRTFIITW